MTRFGENYSIGQILNVFGNFNGVLVFGNILNLLWHKIAIGQILFVANTQTLNKYSSRLITTVAISKSGS